MARSSRSAAERLRITTLEQAAVFRPEAHFSFACFGRNFRKSADVNWSFAPLQHAADAKKNPELCMRLAAAFSALGAYRVYAPSPVKSNAQWVEPHTLDDRIQLSPNIWMFRNGELPADASRLERGDAGAFSAGGCPLIVASCGDEFVYAHAGRWSLIDRNRVNGLPDHTCRRSETVVETVMSHLRAGGKPENVRVWVYGALDPRLYPHPLSGEHADFNKRMRAYVKRVWFLDMQEVDGAILVDLPALIQAQFMRRGISARHVNLDHAHLGNGQDVWLDGAPGKPRNLFAVIRHF